MFRLFTDGGSRGNPGSSASSALLFDDNELIDFTGIFFEEATNNFAEYTALKIGMKLALKHKINKLNCFLDSELVVKQLNYEYKVKNENIKLLFNQIENLKKDFKLIKFTYVPREENKHADKLVNLILDIKKL